MANSAEETTSYPSPMNASGAWGKTAGSTRSDHSLQTDIKLLSPQRLVPLMLLSVFFTEILVMLILATLPPLPTITEALIDSSILLIVLSPTFYFLHYRPMRLHYLSRKQVLDQLRVSEERLNLALEAVNDGLCDWNIASGHAYFSPRTLDMLGYAPGELDERIDCWANLIHPDDLPSVQQARQDHMSGRTSHFVSEHRMLRKDGQWIWVLTRARVVSHDQQDNPIRMVGTHTDITLRKQAEDALRRSEEEVRALTQRMMHISEQEKKHLAQDLHDEFGQVLTAFHMGVDMLKAHQYQGEEEYQFHCQRLLNMAARLDADLRHMCDHLRPLMLDDIGLIAALRWHVSELSQMDDKLKIQFSAPEQPIRLQRDTEIALYRICQEALNNIAKHSRASKVCVSISYDDKRVHLEISDNGIGIENVRASGKGKSTRGFGLLGMRERAFAVGGELQIDSHPDFGTTVLADLPKTI